jgi:hypothetical protein
MGLKDKLLSTYAVGGSTLSYNNGGVIGINPLATKDSKLHATKEGANGYSIDGSYTKEVLAQETKYNNSANGVYDWKGNGLPYPSEIDNEVTYEGKKYTNNISKPTKYQDNSPFGKEKDSQLNYKP